MAVMTMSEAAKTLDIARQHMEMYVARRIVTGKKSGRIVLVDPDQARQELEAYGYWQRREVRRQKKLERALAQNQLK